MKKIVKIMLISISCLAVLIVTTTLAGIRLNITKSYPRGIYQMTNAPIAKGTMVIFCPDNNPVVQEAHSRGYIMAGFCPGGTETMIKKVFAAQNDKVEISHAGVFVNGHLLPNSQPRLADSAGRTLPHVKVTIPALDDRHVLLMSDYSAKSFDGRYFGLTDKSQIISVICPLWTW